jgi:hypothetical protein
MPLSGNEGPTGASSPSAPRRQRGPPQDTGPTFQESLSEAQSRGLDFPAAERAHYVRAMITRVEDYKSAGRTVEEIKTLLPEFARDYSGLFEMVTRSDGYDRATLQTMLAMMDRMAQGSLNPHQATVIVGQRLAQRYIRPSKDGEGRS